jgi:hypothetical protein
VAALGALGNRPGLIEKVCIARDEEIGVYGFVFFRDAEWRPEVIDDKLYLKHPDFDWTKSGVPGNPERNNSGRSRRRKTTAGCIRYFLDPSRTNTMLILVAQFRGPLFRKHISRTTNHTLNHISY